MKTFRYISSISQPFSYIIYLLVNDIISFNIISFNILLLLMDTEIFTAYADLCLFKYL